jgi:hypothetical protein
VPADEVKVTEIPDAKNVRWRVGESCRPDHKLVERLLMGNRSDRRRARKILREWYITSHPKAAA